MKKSEVYISLDKICSIGSNIDRDLYEKRYYFNNCSTCVF